MISEDLVLDSIKRQLDALAAEIGELADISTYSKAEVDNLLASYALQADTYTMSEIDGNTYTRSEIDTLVAGRALATTVSTLATTVSSHTTRLDAVEASIDDLDAFSTDRFIVPVDSSSTLVNYPFGSSNTTREFKILGYTKGKISNTYVSDMLGRIEEYPIRTGARAVHIRCNFHVFMDDTNGFLKAQILVAYKLKTASSYTNWGTIDRSIVAKRQDNNNFIGIVDLEWVLRLDASSTSVFDGYLSLFDSTTGEFNADDYDLGFNFRIKAENTSSEFEVNAWRATSQRPPVISITSFA